MLLLVLLLMVPGAASAEGWVPAVAATANSSSPSVRGGSAPRSLAEVTPACFVFDGNEQMCTAVGIGRCMYGDGKCNQATRSFMQHDLLPSVYLAYDNPTSIAKRSWFSTATTASLAHSTFLAVQMTDSGYFGIQRTLTPFGKLLGALSLDLEFPMLEKWRGIVIFSIWDAADCTGLGCSSFDKCQIVEVGEGAYHQSFGGEGTGCQIKLDVEFNMLPCSFMTTAEDLGNGRTVFTGYWYHLGSGTWKLMGSITTPTTGRGLGDSANSFIEQIRHFDSTEFRAVQIGPQFMETIGQEWKPILAATFRTTSSGVPSSTVARVADGGSQFLAGISGTMGMGHVPDGTRLMLQGSPDPAYSSELQSWIGLRAAGQLPRGCQGWRCNLQHAAIHALMEPFWLGVVALFVLLTGAGLGSCTCCGRARTAEVQYVRFPLQQELKAF
mmetsp:Transcript_15171/g.38529  ORF Transcript_15171/g.38529 Transcript_15171/m.38529 type:complete len:440 (+) Transcript_15171:92-1411(+)